MPHFFINSKNKNGNMIRINDSSNYQHIVKSLRTSVGEKLLLIDETEVEYLTIIEEITKTEIVVKIIDSYKSTRKLDFELYLAQSPLRSEAQNVIMEKATELGITAVYPIYTDNCALKKTVIEQKVEKWQNIMYAASKQCERANIPICNPLTTLDEVVNTIKFNKILALCERNAEKSLKMYLRENPISKQEKVLLIIGPEGGFSEDEFEYFRTHSINMLSLGDLILKAETAVITTIGNIVYEFNK
ncbi:MAG: RsmE family RNA methyltransferase [Candidatus Gastranaerophilaceae bacterium]